MSYFCYPATAILLATITSTSAYRSKRTLVAISPLNVKAESPDFEQVTEPRSVARRQHFPLHLPGSLDPLPCKIQSSPSAFRVEMIENFHQFLTPLPGSVVIKQVELGHALTVEIPKHHACFLIAMSVSPYCIETFRRRCDYVPTVLGRGQ